MNPTPPPSRWSDLVATARRDGPPPVDFDHLLRAARATAARPAGMLEEFTALFASRRALCAVGLATAAALALAVWQGMAAWDQAGPLAEFFSATLGGLS
jgi:hypothetical protein